MSVLRKPAGGAAGGMRGAVHFDDAAFRSRYPALCKFLSLGKWDDGSTRELGTALAFVEGDTIRACLNDKASRRVAFISAATWDKLWEVVEDALVNDSCDWRAVKGAPTQRR